MALIQIPDIKALDIKVDLIGKDAILEGMSGNETIIAPPGKKWAVSMSFYAGQHIDARPWMAAFVQLNNLSNTFELEIPEHEVGSGYTGPNPTVIANSYYHTVIGCDGSTPNTLVGLAGDFIEINGELKMLTEDSISGGDGYTIFNFEPSLRVSPPHFSVVEVKNPKLTCRLIAPMASWSMSKASIFDMKIDAIEAY